MNEILMIALILLPLVGGGVFLLAGRGKQECPLCKAFMPKKGRTVLLCAVLALEVLLTILLVCNAPEAGVRLWQLTDGISFALKVDGLSWLFLILFSVMWLLAGIYSLEYMEHEKHKERFYGFYLMTLASLMGLAMSANIVTLYLFYEFMTLLSLPMVLHSQTPEAKKAGLKYLFYSVGGAFLALGGILLLQGAGIGMDFVAGGRYAAVSCPVGEDMSTPVGRENVMILLGCFLTLIGFGSKAGMFPMQAWLPTAHPVAPAPASAVLSGVITKSGVFAIIRVMYYMVGLRALAGTWVHYTWMGLALITVFMGSMLAYKEKVLKKRLAFSTVSQVSYVMFGLATMHPLGILGALMHIIFHSVIKNTLFFAAGSIIHHTGRTQVSELRGIGKEMPVTMWCFTLVSVALVGIPPTSAFVSKWYLAQGSLGFVNAFGWLAYAGPIVLLLSALLTAGYLITISMRAFLPGDDFDYASLQKKEAGLRMTVPMILLTIAAVGLGMYMTPLTEFLRTLVSMFTYGY